MIDPKGRRPREVAREAKAVRFVVDSDAVRLGVPASGDRGKKARPNQARRKLRARSTCPEPVEADRLLPLDVWSIVFDFVRPCCHGGADLKTLAAGRLACRAFAGLLRERFVLWACLKKGAWTKVRLANIELHDRVFEKAMALAQRTKATGKGLSEKALASVRRRAIETAVTREASERYVAVFSSCDVYVDKSPPKEWEECLERGRFDLYPMYLSSSDALRERDAFFDEPPSGRGGRFRSVFSSATLLRPDGYFLGLVRPQDRVLRSAFGPGETDAEDMMTVAVRCSDYHLFLEAYPRVPAEGPAEEDGTAPSAPLSTPWEARWAWVLIKGIAEAIRSSPHNPNRDVGMASILEFLFESAPNVEDGLDLQDLATACFEVDFRCCLRVLDGRGLLDLSRGPFLESCDKWMAARRKTSAFEVGKGNLPCVRAWMKSRGAVNRGLGASDPLSPDHPFAEAFLLPASKRKNDSAFEIDFLASWDITPSETGRLLARIASSGDTVGSRRLASLLSGGHRYTDTDLYDRDAAGSPKLPPMDLSGWKGGALFECLGRQWASIFYRLLRDYLARPLADRRSSCWSVELEDFQRSIGIYGYRYNLGVAYSYFRTIDWRILAVECKNPERLEHVLRKREKWLVALPSEYAADAKEYLVGLALEFLNAPHPRYEALARVVLGRMNPKDLCADRSFGRKHRLTCADPRKLERVGKAAILLATAFVRWAILCSLETRKEVLDTIPETTFAWAVDRLDDGAFEYHPTFKPRHFKIYFRAFVRRFAVSTSGTDDSVQARIRAIFSPVKSLYSRIDDFLDIGFLSYHNGDDRYEYFTEGEADANLGWLRCLSGCDAEEFSRRLPGCSGVLTPDELGRLVSAAERRFKVKPGEETWDATERRCADLERWKTNDVRRWNPFDFYDASPDQSALFRTMKVLYQNARP